MKSERYWIEVFDDIVLIHGNLTIEEAFDFLNLYDGKGYKCVCPASENSALCLVKEDNFEKIKKNKDEELEEHKEFYEHCYDTEKLEHESTKKKLEDVEYLMKTMFTQEKVKALREQNDVLWRTIKENRLYGTKDIQKMLDDTKLYIDKSRIYADPMEIPSLEE